MYSNFMTYQRKKYLYTALRGCKTEPKSVVKRFFPSKETLEKIKAKKLKLSNEKIENETKQNILKESNKRNAIKIISATPKQITSKNNDKSSDNGVKNQVNANKNNTNKTNSETNQNEDRFNAFNIQMLPKNLFDQLFKNTSESIKNDSKIRKCKQLFSKHNLEFENSTTKLESVAFQLPKLEGSDIIEHFQNIAEKQVNPYRTIINNLLNQPLPEQPKTWLFKPGWTKYEPSKKPIQVPFPEEDGLIFDVEVCMQAGKLPTLATAVSSKAWYGWVSETLTEEIATTTEAMNTIESLIPLEAPKNHDSLNDIHKQPKIIVGHNVSYDRARIKEQYWLEQTGARFLDTMSLHICVSGITSYQRAVLKSGKIDEEDDKWLSYGSLNSLVEVYKLYCQGSLPKDDRDIFVKGSLKDVKDHFQQLMMYCSNDVKATFMVLKQLFPMFLERFPHPVTLAGMLEMNSAYLPVNSNWNRYINDSENTYDDLHRESEFLLTRLADSACDLMHNERYKKDLWMWDQDWSTQSIKIRKTPRKISKKQALQNENISEVTALETKIKISSPSHLENLEDLKTPEELRLENKFASLMTKDLLPARVPLLPGYPTWYRKLCTKPGSEPDWIPGPTSISSSMKVTPKLMRLTWEGYPLHHIANKGWGFLVPFTTDTSTCDNVPLEGLIKKCPVKIFDKEPSSKEMALNMLLVNVQENLGRKEYYSKKIKDKTDVYNGTGVWCDEILEDCCYFFKLPHKDGPTNNVGNPLAKDFLIKFSESVLAGDKQATERTLHISRMLSYWRNNRDRIMNQMVMWIPERYLPNSVNSDDKRFDYGAILPQVVVCGTLTRRAMEPTWMTASNAHEERIGSELRGMVQAPPGFRIVGADVDSQELWIASVIGDAYSCGIHGSTPFGWMTLSGTKANKTDMHSLTAKAVGISRDHAKVINYARIYGAGQNFAERLLKQFNPSMSANDARSKSMKMFEMTKGLRVFRVKEEFQSEELPDRIYKKWEAYKIAKLYGKKLHDMFEKPQWIGGTESAMFNRLEEIAENAHPVTPFLKCRLSRALEPSNMPDERFLPTRVNWVVQSGAVDYLHLMLVSMRWLMGNDARFLLSFHDEVRYLVAENQRYKAALALHLTNLFTRAYCSSALGLNDLPFSVAFFSSVEVDRVLRKESSHDCRTPSNSHGLDDGYDIPPGESLDIYETLKRFNGVFGEKMNEKLGNF